MNITAWKTSAIVLAVILVITNVAWTVAWVARYDNPTTENTENSTSNIEYKLLDTQSMIYLNEVSGYRNQVITLSSNLTAAQSRIAELEAENQQLRYSNCILTELALKPPATVTVEIPTIPPDATVLWSDWTSDNLSYTDFQTYQQVYDYIDKFTAVADVSGDCYEWMMALANQARRDGKPIGLALMFKARADGSITEAHFTNFVIIGNKVLRIEPQTGQISNWDGWRLIIP